MRTDLAALVAAALIAMPASDVHAQVSSSAGATDSSRFAPVLVLSRPTAVQLSNGAAPEPASDREGTALFAQRRQSPRFNYMAVGALIGGVGSTIYAVHDSRDGALGYVGGVLLAPIAFLGGVFIGGAAGYVVSFVFIPPGRTD